MLLHSDGAVHLIGFPELDVDLVNAKAVDSQIEPILVGLGAEVAVVGLLARVGSDVSLEVRSLGEPIAAETAFERPLSSVDSIVLDQVQHGGKRLSTSLAGKRSLPGMHPGVRNHLRLERKALSALGTLERFRLGVGHYRVQLDGCSRCVLLVAVLANKYLPTALRFRTAAPRDPLAMGFVNVAIQGRFLGESLSTFCAEIPIGLGFFGMDFCQMILHFGFSRYGEAAELAQVGFRLLGVDLKMPIEIDFFAEGFVAHVARPDLLCRIIRRRSFFNVTRRSEGKRALFWNQFSFFSKGNESVSVNLRFENIYPAVVFREIVGIRLGENFVVHRVLFFFSKERPNFKLNL